LVLTLLFMATGRWLFSSLTGMITRCLQRQPSVLTAGNMTAIVTASLTDFFLLVLPVFLAAVAAGLVVNFAQTGFLFTTEPLLPQLSRLDPVAGFRRMFSKRSLFELVKSLLKVAVIAFIAFNYIRGTLEKMLLVLYQSTSQIWDSFSTLFTGLALRVGAAFIVLAAADYLYQRYEHEKSLKMTKQELKEEYKQTEGDPLIKSRLRERQRKLAMHRMMESIPEAAVVITNPTELAVALRYREEEDDAPVLVAKGAGTTAQRIRELARKHNVPIVENKPVARMLFRQVDIGQAIPVEMYQAVAEILAVVYRMRGQYR